MLAVRDSLTQTAVQSLTMLIVGIIVNALTKWMHFRQQSWSFDQPRKAALWGLATIFIGWLFITVLFFASISASGPQIPSNETRQFRLSDVTSQALVALLAFGPAMLAMRIRWEPCASAGVTKQNLAGSLLIGGLLAGVIIAGTFFSGDGSSQVMIHELTVNHIWALLYYAVIGFGEEFAYRGYLQTRLMAWLGRWQGWVLTSVLMALVHIPQRMTMQGTSLLEALLSSAALIPISLFLGFVMLRTGNIVAPGLVHTFANWVGTLLY